MNAENLQKADAIVVLGRVDKHGHLTIDAHERIRYAAELYKKGLAPYIVAPANGGTNSLTLRRQPKQK